MPLTADDEEVALLSTFDAVDPLVEDEAQDLDKALKPIDAT